MRSFSVVAVCLLLASLGCCHNLNKKVVATKSSTVVAVKVDTAKAKVSAVAIDTTKGPVVQKADSSKAKAPVIEIKAAKADTTKAPVIQKVVVDVTKTAAPVAQKVAEKVAPVKVDTTKAKVAKK